MKARIIFILFVVSIGSGVPSIAQDFKTVLTELKQKHKAMTRFHIIMKVDARESETKTPFFSEKYEIKRQEDRYWSNNAATSMLMNQHHVIQVNKEFQQIIVKKRNPTSGEDFNNQMKLNLDSMLSFYETPTFNSDKNGEYHFSLHPKTGAVSTIRLSINKESGLLSKIEYSYHAGQVVSIKFEKFNTNPVFEESTFADTNFIVNTGNLVKPAPLYNGFQITTATE